MSGTSQKICHNFGGGKLFGGTVPPNKKLFGGTVPPNKKLFGGTVPPNKILFGGTVPPSKNYLVQLSQKLKCHRFTKY